MNKIKACIFDLDGTLLNTLSGITYYINKTFEGEGIDPVSEDEAMRALGHGARNLITSLLSARSVTDPSRVELIVEKYTSLYDLAPMYLVEPYDGICELIDELISRGIRIAVISNKPEFATKEIVRSFFGDKISCVAGGRVGVPLKPDPTVTIEVLRELSVSFDECAFIGDGETDFLTAKNAGIALPISVLWGFRTREQLTKVGARSFVHEPRDILKLLK